MAQGAQVKKRCTFCENADSDCESEMGDPSCKECMQRRRDIQCSWGAIQHKKKIEQSVDDAWERFIP